MYTVHELKSWHAKWRKSENENFLWAESITSYSWEACGKRIVFSLFASPSPLPQHSTTPSSTTLYTDSVTVDSTAPTIVPLHNTAHMTRVGVFQCTYSDTAQSQVDHPDTFANRKTTALKLHNKTTNKWNLQRHWPTPIHSKSKKVCGFHFSVLKNLRKKCVNHDDKFRDKSAYINQKS